MSVNRKIVLFIILLIIAGFLTGCASTPAGVNPLAGAWSFENPGYEDASLVFSPEYQITMTFDASRSMHGEYWVDYSFDPVHLDITWLEMGTVKTIIRFIGEDKLQLQNSDLEVERPVEFSDDSVILLRVQASQGG